MEDKRTFEIIIATALILLFVYALFVVVMGAFVGV